MGTSRRDAAYNGLAAAFRARGSADQLLIAALARLEAKLDCFMGLGPVPSGGFSAFTPADAAEIHEPPREDADRSANLEALLGWLSPSSAVLGAEAAPYTPQVPDAPDKLGDSLGFPVVDLSTVVSEPVIAAAVPSCDDEASTPAMFLNELPADVTKIPSRAPSPASDCFTEHLHPAFKAEAGTYGQARAPDAIEVDGGMLFAEEKADIACENGYGSDRSQCDDEEEGFCARCQNKFPQVYMRGQPPDGRFCDHCASIRDPLEVETGTPRSGRAFQLFCTELRKQLQLPAGATDEQVDEQLFDCWAKTELRVREYFDDLACSDEEMAKRSAAAAPSAQAYPAMAADTPRQDEEFELVLCSRCQNMVPRRDFMQNCCGSCYVAAAIAELEEEEEKSTTTPTEPAPTVIGLRSSEIPQDPAESSRRWCRKKRKKKTGATSS